jgi:short-subunit dehydrogenase
MSESIADRVVVITGASDGIGAAIATAAARRGARLVLAARREAKLAEVAARARAAGSPAVSIVVTDVTKRADHAALFTRAVKEHGAIDVWINNAGATITRAPSQLTEEDFDDMMLINVKSALWGMQAVLPHLQQRARGQIINVSSLLGRVPFALPRAMYSASKHALNALSTSMRMEARAQFPDVWITTVYAGIVATDFGLNGKYGSEETNNRLLPMAQPVDEVAAIVVGAIEAPCAEVFTRAEFKKTVADYYAAPDLAVVESRPPFAARMPSTALTKEFFDSTYHGVPPWDVGAPQTTFVALAKEGRIKGAVLDVGCGTGEHALWAASLGYAAVGVDSSPKAIAKANAKAAERHVDASFTVGDATALEKLGRTFDTILDAGLFHVLADVDRPRYADSLAKALAPGGRVHILAFSDREASEQGPRRVSEAELRATFGGDWQFETLTETRMQSLVHKDGAHAWLATLTRR